MQFSIWHWAIVLLIIGVPVFFAVRSGVKPSSGQELAGFGGWLLLLAIGETLAPLRTLAEMGSELDSFRQLMAMPNGTFVVYGEVALSLAFVALQLVVLVAMFRRSPRFRQLFVCQWLALPISFVLDTLLVSSGLGVSIGEVITPQSLGALVGSLVVSGLWVAYLYKSVRVRNTFGTSGVFGRAVSA
jgi:hypothetical protein